VQAFKESAFSYRKNIKKKTVVRIRLFFSVKGLKKQQGFRKMLCPVLALIHYRPVEDDNVTIDLSENR